MDFVGDLSFEEFSKTSLVEELMASDESGADDDDGDGVTERTAEKEKSSADHEHSSLPPQNDPSVVTTDQAETFATELSSIQTARRRNLITGSLSVSKRWLAVYSED